MILHIIGATMYTKDFCVFINENFKDTEPIFVNRLNKKDPRYQDLFFVEGVETAAVVSPMSFAFIKDVYKSDAIILHALFNFKYILFLGLQPWLLKKCNWIVWGGDIYCHAKENKTYIEKLKEKLKKRICSRLKYVTTLAENDFQLLKDWYGYSGEHFEVKYPTPLTRNGVEEILKKSRIEKLNDARHPIKIMIGNSATESNQHFQALDFLEKFKDQDILVYLPLSYGMAGDYIRYGDKVIAYAQEKIGTDKVIPIRECMDGTKYVELISQMDVGIFNCNRQQAMGNISVLFAAEAKVYIRTDTVMWDNYINRGNVVHNIEKIPEMTFEDFWKEDFDIKKQNLKIIEYNTSVAANRERWGKIFKTMTSPYFTEI